MCLWMTDVTCVTTEKCNKAGVTIQYGLVEDSCDMWNSCDICVRYNLAVGNGGGQV